MKRVLLITACQVGAEVALLTLDASSRSLNWVFISIYLSGDKGEKVCAVSVKGK
jgi:hypothetical protein